MKDELAHWRIWERKDGRFFQIQYREETFLSKFIRKYFRLDDPNRPLKTKWKWYKKEVIIGETVTRTPVWYSSYDEAIASIECLQSEFRENDKREFDCKNNKMKGVWKLISEI